MDERDQILKQDSRGRVWTPREQRDAILDEFERSGLPATKFSAHVGVKYATFANWVQKRRKARRVAAAVSDPGGALGPMATWVEAARDTRVPGSGRTLLVHLPGGARLEIADESQALLAANLLHALSHGGARC
jgi:hypothetical protein